MTRKNHSLLSVIFLNFPSSYSRIKDRTSSFITAVTMISARPFRLTSATSRVKKSY